MNFLLIFRDLVVESAPWLLLGFFLAGIIKQIIPAAWVEKQLAKPGLVSIVKGALIGAPLPLCSCGVIPAALAVRKAGASKGATSSFLVATPETGVDSISFSYAVLGPVFAIARPLAALFSAIIAGILVTLLDKEAAVTLQPAANCCAGTCDGKKAEASVSTPNLLQKLHGAFSYGYGTMIADTAKWLLIGLLAAAVITAVVPESFFLRWGDGLLAMLVMVLVGLPMYICATASTPVAASLLFAGVSPGAALVFMLTGPATNIATMGLIREQMGTRSLVAYLLGVIGGALVSGLLLNALFAAFAWDLQIALTESGAGHALWQQLLGVVLVLLIARVWLQPLFMRLQKQSRGHTRLTSSLPGE